MIPFHVFSFLKHRKWIDNRRRNVGIDEHKIVDDDLPRLCSKAA